MANFRKHNLPIGTVIKIDGEHTLYEVASYQELLGPCEDPCTLHDGGDDCYPEPFITVRKCSYKAFPVSSVSIIFDQPDHSGRKVRESDGIS